MTQTAQQTVASVTLQTNKPTHLSAKDLFNWVIWQFPQPKEGGFCGAVHPPLPDHPWYPAIIRDKGQQIQVYGHLEDEFATPEEAMSYLNQIKTT